VSEEQQSIARPWSIVGAFESYEAADKKRNDMISENKKLQVKVKRYSDGVFKIKARIDPTLSLEKKNDKKSTKKDKPRKSKRELRQEAKDRKLKKESR
jgi:hypothetical protein